MRAVAFRYRIRPRGYWRSWIVLALLSGVALSLAMAAAGNARRADTALPRALAAGHAADVAVNADETSVGRDDGVSYLAAVDRLPGIVDEGRLGGVDLAEINNDGTLGTRLAIGSALGKLVDDGAIDTVGKFRVLEGRLPAPGRADEVVVNPEVLAVTGWRVGQQITSLKLFRLEDLDENLEPDPSKGTPLTLTIVGVARRPEELLDDAATRAPQIYLFPAFAQTYPDSTFYINDFIKLSGGDASEPTFRDAVAKLATDYPHNQLLVVRVHDGYSLVQDALRPQVTAVWLLAAVLFIAGLLLAAQAIGRQILAHNRDLGDLRALGMTPRQLGLLGLLHGTTIAVSASIIAAVVAWLSSSFTPVGSTHGIEPHPGLRFDAPVLVVGMAVTAIALALSSFAAARRLTRSARKGVAQTPMAGGDRPLRIVGLLARAGLPPTVVTGARFALQRGSGRSATPVRSVLASIALAASVLVVAMSFSADLDHLVHTPRLYGWDWDVGIGTDFGSIPDEAVQQLRQRPEIGAIAGFTQGTLRLGDTEISAVGVDQFVGTIFPTLDQGRVPLTDGDIVLGRLTMADLHKSVGDTIDVGTPAGDKTMTIVGVATFPAIGSTRFAETALGRGAATVASLFPPDDPNSGGTYNGVFIRLAPGVDRGAAIDGLRQYVGQLGCNDSSCLLTDSRPAQLSGYAKLGALWVPFAFVLGLLLAISLSHGIATTTLARRRDLAIFSALGWKRSQAGRVVLWQSVTTIVVALVIALPLGIVCANIGWRIFTDHFGIRPPVSLPVPQLALLVLVALLSAVVVRLTFVPNARRARTIERLVGE